MNAAEFPDGSIVVGRRDDGREVVFIKDHPTPAAAWRGTDGGYYGDRDVNNHLAGGGESLRIGRGAP